MVYTAGLVLPSSTSCGKAHFLLVTELGRQVNHGSLNDAILRYMLEFLA